MFNAPPAATSSAPSNDPFAQLTTALLATVKLAPEATFPLFQFNRDPPSAVNELPELIVPLFQFKVTFEASVNVAPPLNVIGPLKL